MADNEAKLIITAQDNVSSAIKKISESLGSSGLGQAITAASTGFLALKAAGEMVVAGVSAVTNQFHKAIEAAAESESVNRKLALSFLSTGEYSKEAFNATAQWASEMERATGITDEAAMKLVTLSKNMGQTVEQARNTAAASIDMAAALGMDAETAARQLSMTMQGMAGRLGRMVPEINALTKTQLQNGEAVEIIRQKYMNFAKDSANTFDGATSKIKTQLDNVYEAFGKMIVQNPVVISAMTSIAQILEHVASVIGKLSDFVINNMSSIKSYAAAFGIAAVAVGGYLIAINAATIATTALTMATIVYNTVSKLTPWGLAIAAIGLLTVAIGYLIDNWEKVIAVVQKYAGIALQKVIQAIKFVTQAHLALVSIFSKDLANSIKKTLTSLEAYGKQMEQNGQAAQDAATAADASGKAQTNAADGAANAIKGLEGRANEASQAIVRLRNEYAKAATKAEEVFGHVKEFTPRIQLDKMKADAEMWKATLKELEDKAKAVTAASKVTMGPPSAADTKYLEKVKEDERNARMAIKGLEMKIAIETREAKIKEVDLQLQQEKMMNISVSQEIMMKRVEFQNQLRTQLIAIESERLLEERGIQDANARAGIDVRQASMLAANDVELNAYKAGLEAQMNLAVEMENQKASALAAVKASATAGLGGPAEAGGAADATIANEEIRQDKLDRLREADKISEENYQEALTASVILQTNARIQQEVALNQQRAQLLGLTAEGRAARIDAENVEHQAKMDALVQRHADELLSDQEFQMSKEQAELDHKARLNEINEQFYNDSADRDERLGNDWDATLNKVRAATAAHGDAMDGMQVALQSKQVQGMSNMFGNISSLMNTHNKKAFAVGKAAAIAQAMINIPLSAIMAYKSMVGIPLVGPGLAVAAAAAAVMAGTIQMQQIASRQMSAAHGGIDEVPSSMDNKTFLLKGGERVLQPEANKDITQAADTINKNGGGKGGNVININITGSIDKTVLTQLKTTMIDILRSESERGTPIINERGLVRAS